MVRHRVPMTLRNFFFSDPFFRNTWTDFDKVEREFMKESRNLFKALEHASQRQEKKEDSQNTGKAVSNGHTGGDRQLDYFPRFFPRSWFMPSPFTFNEIEDTLGQTLRRMDLFKDGDEHVMRVVNDDQKFEVSVDTSGFKPEELTIKAEGNTLTVEGKHEQKGEDRFVSKEFHRVYTLPKQCKMEDIHSNLSSDGVLVITAPKKAEELEEGRTIPIETKK